MCGVVGVLTRPGQQADPSVAAMLDRLRHRGPDSFGLWSDFEAGVVLGHRRLAVIDLSPAGRQPMLSSSGRYVLTFNGEIYNFRELREELVSSGQRFRGTGDTEVLLAAIERWGLEEALRRSVGMFAGGLWDRRERRLRLFRDRMGEKPLYLAKAADGLLFASELGALAAWPGLRTTLDPAAVRAFFRGGYVPAPLSIWREVRKLQPGRVLELATEDLALPEIPVHRARSYWSLIEVAAAALRARVPLHDDDAVVSCEQLLLDAVTKQSVADVPLGVFLSGGIDSSLVLALLQEATGRPARAFTLGFEQEGYDERAAARRIAGYLGSEHVELQLTAGQMLENIPRLARIFDEPFADPSQLPTLLVAELARRHVTVALCGDGGDELFGGYDRYLAARRLASLLRAPRSLRRCAAAVVDACGGGRLSGVVGLLPTRVRGPLAAAVAGDRLRKLATALAAEDEVQLVRRLSSVWDDPTDVLLPADSPEADWCEPERGGLAPDDLSELMMLGDALSWLPDCVLTKVDRATMAVSLEARAPFLDHRVVEFAWRVPINLKIRGGMGKWLLRRILARHLPERLLNGTKIGFRPPLGAWLRGPLRDWAESLLSPNVIADSGLLDTRSVARLWREHVELGRERGDRLWTILAFLAWLDADRADRASSKLHAPAEARAGLALATARAGGAP